MTHHFILTRFNLPLWKYDKHNHRIDAAKWIEERLSLFETYCLPSVASQSCKDFTWVLLCDENTPEKYRERIKGYRIICPQIELIQVEDGYAWKFPDIFSEVVTSMLEKKGVSEGDICLTTQLDNDDALSENFIANVVQYVSDGIKTDTWMKRCVSFDGSIGEVCFVSFDYGIQYYADLTMATRVRYPNNHFMTCVERVHKVEVQSTGDSTESANTAVCELRACYGYGSHFLLEENTDIPVHHITDKYPMWCETIHDNNVDNDVKMTFDTEIIKDVDMMKRDYHVDVLLRVHIFAFAVRCFGQILRRMKYKVISRKWR